MLDRLDQQPPDALLALIKLHDADPRDDKIDLGVGVYKTADGATPVFECIKQAEARLVETQDTKAYLGPEGDMGFVRALRPHVFGEALAAAECSPECDYELVLGELQEIVAGALHANEGQS